MTEKIKSHPIMDIWQVRGGLLVEVLKYKSTSVSRTLNGAKTKIVRGCSGLKELKEDWVISGSGEVFPAGTLFLHGTPVEPLADPSDFKFGIKSSGGAVYGTSTDISRVLNHIQQILASYKEEN